MYLHEKPPISTVKRFEVVFFLQFIKKTCWWTKC